MPSYRSAKKLETRHPRPLSDLSVDGARVPRGIPEHPSARQAPRVRSASVARPTVPVAHVPSPRLRTAARRAGPCGPAPRGLVDGSRAGAPATSPRPAVAGESSPPSRARRARPTWAQLTVVTTTFGRRRPPYQVPTPALGITAKLPHPRARVASCVPPRTVSAGAGARCAAARSGLGERSATTNVSGTGATWNGIPYVAGGARIPSGGRESGAHVEQARLSRLAPSTSWGTRGGSRGRGRRGDGGADGAHDATSSGRTGRSVRTSPWRTVGSRGGARPNGR